MCGIPDASRITATGADNPETVSVPETGGSGGAGIGGGAGAAGVRQAALATSAGTMIVRSRLRNMSLRERLLADYDHEIASTRRVLTQLPDARLGWTPHERSRTMSALAAHLTDVLSGARVILTAASFDLDDASPPSPPLPSAAGVLAAFEAAAQRTRNDLDRSDAEFKALWCLKRAGVELFVLPREAAFRSFILHHMIHHRGQLTVYLRLVDLPVPAIYGPSADSLSPA
jgi:uncharacterized damage-inducible protein DinB